MKGRESACSKEEDTLSRFRRFRIPALTRDLYVAGLFGVGVWLVIWGSEVLRLDVGGQSLVWPAVVAFGLSWRVSRRWRLARAVGLGVGTGAGILGFFASALLLPPSSLGLGIGVGLTAAMVFVAARLIGRYAFISTGATLVGLGSGVAIGMGADIGATTGWADGGALVTASSVAIALGTFGGRVIERWTVLWVPGRKACSGDMVEMGSRVSANEAKLRIVHPSEAAIR